MYDVTGWAWAAGFIEGEGSFSIRQPTSRPYKQLVFQVWQCNREPLDKLGALINEDFGEDYGPLVNVNGPYVNNSGFKKKCVLKPKYGIIVARPSIVQGIFENTASWLSQEKIDQALRAIDAWYAYQKLPPFSVWWQLLTAEL